MRFLGKIYKKVERMSEMEKRKIYRIILGILIIVCSVILAAFIYYSCFSKKQSKDGILVKRFEVRLNNGWKA